MEQAAATELISVFARELETAIAASNWGEVCKLVERSFFDPQISDQTDCPIVASDDLVGDRTYEV